MRRLLAALAILTGLLSVPAIAATPAHASTESLGNQILDTALTRAGDWYVYGAAGPSAFDCSGLVVWAAGQHGIALPRTTYAMPSSWHLYRVYSPQRGDIAFFGTGHVEIVTAGYHQTFGAHHTGTQVGYQTWNNYWAPTAFYRFR